MKKEFNFVAASFLTIPSIGILIHSTAILILTASGKTSPMSSNLSGALVIFGLLLPPAVLVCGIWAVRHSLSRMGRKFHRYSIAALNAVAVGIGFYYALCIFNFIVEMGPINPG